MVAQDESDEKEREMKRRTEGKSLIMTVALVSFGLCCCCYDYDDNLFQLYTDQPRIA